ncbi:hypothetical protein LTR27_004611 [Elasticomyces elasticus]|nr:hypothetical protein LTR27_004611 [Elasticomyces elasticus]
MPPKTAAPHRCLRCKGYSELPHKTLKCDADLPSGDTVPFADFAAGGNLNDVPALLEDCKNLLTGLTPLMKGDRQKQVVLEAAYQKVKQSNADKNTKKKQEKKAAGPPPNARVSAKPLTAVLSNKVRDDKLAKVGAETSTPAWQLSPRYESGLAQTDLAPKESELLVWNACQTDNHKDSQASDTKRRGKSGERTDVATNYVVVNRVPQKYGKALPTATTTTTVPASSTATTTITPPPVPREIKRGNEKRLVFDALKLHPTFAGRQDWATDYTTIWSLTPLEDPERIPADGDVSRVYNVKYRKPTGREAELEYVQFTVSASLSFPRTTPTAPTLSLLDANEDTIRGASIHIAALNGLISRHVTELAAGVNQSAPNKFFLTNGFDHMAHPDNPDDVSNRMWSPLNAHRGYYSSIRPGSDSVLLNINTKAGAFLHPMKVSEFMECINHEKYEEYGGAEAVLTGRQVRIMYERASLEKDDSFDPNVDGSRHKTVVALGSVPSKQTFFHAGLNFNISVMEYYQHFLKADPLPSDDWRCVNVGLKSRHDNSAAKELWIPADFLELDPNQPFNQKLGAHDMEKMLQAAQHTPAQMQSLLVHEAFDKLGLVGALAKQSLNTLDLDIQTKLLQVPGRFLPIPRIAFQRTQPVTPRDASWFMEVHNEGPGQVYFRPPAGVHTRIHVLDLCRVRYGDNAVGLARELSLRLAQHGITFANASDCTYLHFAEEVKRKYPDRKGDDLKLRVDQWSDADLVTEFNPLAANPAQLFLVLLDNANTAINVATYAKVKRVFDQRLGLHTVCLTSPKFTYRDRFRRPKVNFLSNLALKFNLKLGGQSHQVFGPAKPAFADIASNTIVLGADVSHAPSKMEDCPSVAAVVGNIDKHFATFPGSMRLQAKGQEWIEELESMVTERVLAYARETKDLPTRMIFYRDGIGEDQFDNSSKVEIERVRNGYNAARSILENDNRSKPDSAVNLHSEKNGVLDLVFIVVGKRHNTRFFCRNEAQTTRGGYRGNVKPGLIVDSVITRPNVTPVFDFFLQSHAALKGTAKSGHYIVLESGTMLADEIQTLTHAFCYNYARACKGVSYAGPAYYADRLCERGTQYLKAYTNSRVDNRPALVKKQAEIDGGKAALPGYQKAVAEHVSLTNYWNPNPTRVQGRKNPWHPNLDKIMFWL